MEGTGVVLERSFAGEMVCRSPVWKKIFRRLEKLAPLSSLVFVTGETGTGKYLIAKALHELGERPEPFVDVYCPAITDTLFESELFGNESGAFTNASHRRCGLIEAAKSGTVHLDEIACLDSKMQTKLLGILDRGTYRRLGSTTEMRVNARIVAATNGNLAELARQGVFRPDLLYRLNEARICIPPLRERKEDIMPLVEYFLRNHALNPEGRILLRCEDRSMFALENYPWPGNVREVRNAVAEALIENEREELSTEKIYAAVLELQGEAPEPPKSEGGNLIDKQDRRFIEAALTAHAGNVSRTARSLGVQRTTLRYKIEKLGISHRFGKP